MRLRIKKKRQTHWPIVYCLWFLVTALNKEELAAKAAFIYNFLLLFLVLMARWLVEKSCGCFLDEYWEREPKSLTEKKNTQVLRLLVLSWFSRTFLCRSKRMIYYLEPNDLSLNCFCFWDKLTALKITLNSRFFSYIF